MLKYACRTATKKKRASAYEIGASHTSRFGEFLVDLSSIADKVFIAVTNRFVDVKMLPFLGNVRKIVPPYLSFSMIHITMKCCFSAFTRCTHSICFWHSMDSLLHVPFFHCIESSSEFHFQLYNFIHNISFHLALENGYISCELYIFSLAKSCELKLWSRFLTLSIFCAVFYDLHKFLLHFNS